MFSIFEASSFTSISKNSKPTPPQTPAQSSLPSSTSTNTIQQTQSTGFSQKQIKRRNIVGTRFRSKTGCLNCRKRKKKCDETSPICQACQARNQECVWPDLTSRVKTNKRVVKPTVSTTKRIPARASVSAEANGAMLNSVSSTVTPSGASSRLSPVTKSTSPASTISCVNDTATVSTWKYDSSLLSFDPALIASALPVSSTRNETTVKPAVSSVVSEVNVRNGLVDFDNEHEEAMDDVGHLNMNVLLT